MKKNYNLDYKRLLNNDVFLKSEGIYDYDEAENILLDAWSQFKLDNIKDDADASSSINHSQTKADLVKHKEIAKRVISETIRNKNISVRGYQGTKINLFIDEMVNEFVGYSILNDAFIDPEVDDIFCVDWNKIWVNKKDTIVKYHKTFRDKSHYNKIIERFLSLNGKEINIGSNSIVDGELFGDRVNATSEAVSPASKSITIRKHKGSAITIYDLYRSGILNEYIGELFEVFIKGQQNLIIGGITGSGKTTTLRGVFDKNISETNLRAIVAEDTQELTFDYDHILYLLSTRESKKENDISLYDLILLSLRLKPNYNIIGEVRGAEAVAMIESMETGHASITTMHGGEPWNIINRLVTKYMQGMPSLGIEVVERIIGTALDYIIIQDNIPGIGRRITSISEVGYDFEEKRMTLKKIVEYDFQTMDYKLYNLINKEKARTMFRRAGLENKEKIDKWIESDDENENLIRVEKINNDYFETKEEFLAKMEREAALNLGVNVEKMSDDDRGRLSEVSEGLDTIEKAKNVSLIDLQKEALKTYMKS